MPEFASKGVAGAGLGLGIAGTALALLNNGILGNGAVNPNTIEINRPEVEVAMARRYHNNHFVSRYELDLIREISNKDAIISNKDSVIYTNKEIKKVYDDLNAYKLDIEKRFAYDERLINNNKCEIEKTNRYIESNYIKADKVLRPWDICPQPWNQSNTTEPSTES